MGKQGASKQGREKRKKRFRFKTFLQRVEEVDIDVFRGLDAVKFQPTEGSSFFHESLIQWRELNAAKEFVSLYEELLPLVQTLAQLLLHKAAIVTRLLDHLHPSAVLSLQPILSVLAVLSRDLGEDFLPFLPQIFNSFVVLLEEGGDRDPAILEMVFTSASYIFKYMLKLLSRNIIFSLKITKPLRHYHQNYVRVFAAESVSYLLRNASVKETIKGVRKVLREVELDPIEEKVISCSTLFHYTLQGPSDGFHSCAGKLLKLLLNQSILAGIRKECCGKGDTVLEVLKRTFTSLCEDVDTEKLQLLWSSLFDELTPVLVLLEHNEQNVPAENILRLIQLSSLLNSLVGFGKGRLVNDYEVLSDLVSRMMFLATKLEQSELLSQIFHLLLNILIGHWHSVGGLPARFNLQVPPWTQAFASARQEILLSFVKDILEQEVDLIKPFLQILLSILDRFVYSNRMEVYPLLLKLLEKLEWGRVDLLPFSQITSSISSSIDDIKMGSISEEEAALVWIALRCIPCVTQSSICFNWALAVDNFLQGGAVTSQDIWVTLLGTALTSHLQILKSSNSDIGSQLRCFLDLGMKYKSSPQVLNFVADCLTAATGIDGCIIEPGDFNAFQENLANPNRAMRLATLQILSYGDDEVIHELQAIESSSMDLDQCRRGCSNLLQIKLRCEAKKFSSDQIVIVFRALIGLLHNRLTLLWNPVLDCLVAIGKEFGNSVWDYLLQYICSTQRQCLTQQCSSQMDAGSTRDFISLWRSQFCETPSNTPAKSILILLLQVAKKVPSFVARKCEELVQLFFDFVSFKDEKFDQALITGSDWKQILKEWLPLLEHVRNIHAVSESSRLKQMLMNRFLSYNDAEIQQRTLVCLVNWKDAYLIPYKDHLRDMISLETFREELLAWDISLDSGNIELAHREELIPVLLRILYPKLIKRARKAGKSGSTYRTPILSYLSYLSPSEVGKFYTLVLDPLRGAISSEGMEKWQNALEQGDTQCFINWVDASAMAKLPRKRKIGFLYLAKDVLDVFAGDCIEPYLPALLAFVLRILQSASSEENLSEETLAAGGKDMRTLCLKFIYSLFNKFDNISVGAGYWNVFFSATKHSAAKLREDNVSSSQPSAFLSCILAMSRTREAVPLLLRSTTIISNMLSILNGKTVSTSVHSAVLGTLESMLFMEREHILLLVPSLPVLLSGLATQLSRTRYSSELVKRQLHILSKLGEFIKDPLDVGVFLDSLLPFLRPKKNLDSDICIDVLKTICASSGFDTACALKCCEALGPFLTFMTSHEARIAACQLLKKIALLEPSFSSVVEIIDDLNSMSHSVIGEYDYERRQKAYDKLSPRFFSLCSSKQAVLLISQLVFDLGSEDMRYNASACLLSIVKAVEEDVLQQDVKTVVQDLMLSQFRNGIKSEIATLRMEWMIVFRQLVSCSGSPKLSEYRCLIDADPEADFFHNIVHVQIHKRVKAMARFRSACIKSLFSQETLRRIFIPLFMHFLFESRGHNDGSTDAAIETIGTIAAQLQWTTWFKLLMRSFRFLATKNDYQKTLIRLICVILDTGYLATKTQEGSKSDLEGRLRDVTEALQQRVLPELERLMLKDDSVNMSVAVAITKVLKLLPQEVMETQLPRILQTVVNLLKNRLQDTRDEARSALVSMAEVLGSQYLKFIVNMLQASLKRGYERHVLGYTVNTILIRMVPKLEVGDIDYCVKDILSIINAEIFGEVAEEKEIQELANKMKERKQVRSYDSLRLVCQAVTFGPVIDHLLGPVRENVVNAKTAEKTRSFLRSIAAGIQGNASATEEEVLVFVRKLIVEFLKQEAAADVPAHFLAEFALQLLQSHLKNSQLRVKGPEVMEILDGLVGPLHQCLSLKYEGVISGALKSLGFLSRLTLPAMEAKGAEIFSAACAMAEVSSNAENPVTQACLKLLIEALRHWKTLSLSDDELHTLLQLPIFMEVEGVHALSLLKGIVERKLVVPRLYDLMERVQQVMITSQVLAIQRRCSEVLLLFLLDYPLGPKRLQHHMDFLLINLGYEHISGREAALEMLHTVIEKFPEPVLEEHSETFFLTLVIRLVNEQASHVLVLLETAIKILMRRASPATRQRVRELLLSWMHGEKQALRQAAARVTGLLIDVMGTSFKSYLADFLPPLVKLLESSDEYWQAALYSLLVIEKLAILFPSHELHRREELWTLASRFLLHKQLVLMAASARLFSLYLETMKHPSDSRWLLFLASHFTEQLNSPELNEDLAEQIVKNLNLLVPSLHSLPVNSLVDEQADGKQDEKLSKAFSLLQQVPDLGDNSALMLAIRRVEKIALRFQVLQTKSIFKWYTCLIAQMPGEQVVPYLPVILGPLLRIKDSTEASEGLKRYAEEVRNEIRGCVGAETYALLHNDVSQKMRSKKEKRKREQSIAVLVDPQKSARKKIRLGLKKKIQKKRKRAEFRS